MTASEKAGSEPLPAGSRRFQLGDATSDEYRPIPSIDATGIHTLTDVVRRSRRDGTMVLLSGVQPQPRAALMRSALFDEVGEEHVCANFEEALERANEELEVRRLLRRTGEVPAARG